MPFLMDTVKTRVRVINWTIVVMLNSLVLGKNKLKVKYSCLLNQILVGALVEVIKQFCTYTRTMVYLLKLVTE